MSPLSAEQYMEHQPEYGEEILICRELLYNWENPGNLEMHWYALNVEDDGTPGWLEFTRTDERTHARSEGRARFAALCRDCHMSVQGPGQLAGRLAGQRPYYGGPVRKVSKQ